MSIASLIRHLQTTGVIATLLAMAVSPATHAGVAPNVILIVADDLGAHDLGVSGSRFHETPNLDRLAREGMQFTQAYAAGTVCSPTRAALLTGKYPARLRLTDWIPGEHRENEKLHPPEWTKQLGSSEVTLAEHLKSAGYSTALIGKWHLGGPEVRPERQGFDLNRGGDHRGQPPSYFSPYGLPRLIDGPIGEYLTDREGDEAVEYIATHTNRPFLLQVCFHGVHTPLQAKPELVDKYRRKPPISGTSQTNAVYAAMLESLDAAVGRILQSLVDHGIAGNTLVIFSSDNGGLVLGSTPPTSNAPLRSGKGSPYEGGVRVPLIIRWPGVVSPSSSCAIPVISMDLPATVLEACGLSVRVVDGRSLVPLFRNPGDTLDRSFLAWHYPHYHRGGATPYAAIRGGDWKLIQFFEDGRHELFNLRADPAESTNLALPHPDKLEKLTRQLSDWQQSVNAQWPKTNPFVPFSGRGSVWFGFDRHDFAVDGMAGLVVSPKAAAPGRPWVWHGEFFGHKPDPDIALLRRGFHVAYLSVPDQLGSPEAVAKWNRFYGELSGRHGLASKPGLVGLSRGGLYCYNWAIANPDKVSCIYGDAPVCDFRSWPGAFGKGKRSDRDWQLVLSRYGFKSDAEARAYSGNPVDKLAGLAAAKIPLLHVYGDADEVVPWDENTGVVAERYRTLGGSITLIAKPGVHHHPHGLEDSRPIVDFLWEHAASSEAHAWLEESIANQGKKAP